MAEYKHTDVFYVRQRASAMSRDKSDDKSEIAQSTEYHSQRNEAQAHDSQAKSATVGSGKLDLSYEGMYRLFGVYFYRLTVWYNGRAYSDCFLLERDALCDNFFELYVKDLLMTHMQDQFVTHHEANSKLSRH